MTKTSTLLVKDFPRVLRRQVHAKATLEGKFVSQIYIELIAKALAQEAKKEPKP